jgi:NDP-sugar pyrophosphorylase family protein
MSPARELQIVVPMAGRGSRFADDGYPLPKPLIDVAGAPMIEVVIENLRPARPHRFVFVVQGTHVREHAVDTVLRQTGPGCAVVEIESVTRGAACTVLEARPEIDPDAPLMIANCDQWIDARVDDYLGAIDALNADGGMMVMPESDPKWSFAEVGDDGWVRRVAEKEPISDIATVGIYNFRAAGEFMEGAESMIEGDKTVNGEFYVAPVYNELIGRGARIGTWNVETVGPAMYGLGTPLDLRRFLADPPARFVATRPSPRF